MSTNFKVNGVDISNTFAPLASPGLSGTPTAPTATSGTNTTQIATTAFVKNQGYALASSVPSVTGYAPLASPDFTGTPKAPTAPTDTNTEQIATTAFVMTQGSAIKSYVDNKTNSLSTLTNYASLANDNTFTKNNFFNGTVYIYNGSNYVTLKSYIDTEITNLI